MKARLPKQFMKVRRKELLCYTIECFNSHPEIDEIYIVTLEKYMPLVHKLVDKYNFNKVKNIFVGGSTRQESVRNGINGIMASGDVVLIHDGDRPFVNKELITNLITETEKKDNASPIVPIDEFPKGTSNSGRKIEINKKLYSVQTPQCFIFETAKYFHNRLSDSEHADDASMYEECIGKAKYIPGDKENIKITTIRDFRYMKKKCRYE